MIYLQSGLYVVIEQLETALAPQPQPLSHGFSKDVAYLVLGGFSLAESADAFFVLSNDRDEIWFISNRHLRTHSLLRGSTAFRLPLAARDARVPAKRNGAGAPKLVVRGARSHRKPSR